MIEPADRERLALVVHEVRSPVAALAAIAVASRGSLDRDVLPELLRLALAACRGIERVVLDVAPASALVEEVDAGRLVRDAARAATLDGALVRAEVEPAVSPPRGLALEADPLRIRQALDNLIENAVAHTGPGREVVVSARVEEDLVLLAVSDTGLGIAVEDQDRIFEPGVRLDVGRPGSGLGLAIARAIAEAHGGSLTVTSAPGAGATFTIALPLTRG